MQHLANNMRRRECLTRIGGGFAGLALTAMEAQDSIANPAEDVPASFLLRDAKVRRVIQLFMTGGASPMDLFDYKPALEKLHGQMLGPKEKPEGFTGPAGSIMKSPFRFRQHGQSGRWVSELFPHQARHVDDMAFLMAMTSKTNVHGPATYMMNTGFLTPGFPCFGAWISYGLGRIVDDLPTFIALPDPKGLPYNQRGAFSAGFLPAIHQGTVIDANLANPLPDLFASTDFTNAGGPASAAGLRLLDAWNRQHAAAHPSDSRLEARIASYELAAKMQLSAPEAFDLTTESAASLRAYGVEQPATADFGKRCLLARRLIERGVRFVQIWSGPQGAVNNWDNHANIPAELPPMALSVDQPIAALLRDLKARGLMDDTLVVWTTEFGRTPFAQGTLGRDHNGGSFVTWLAGAGIRAGSSHGQSDEWGYQGIEGRTYCYDLHATLLHLMGIDHERLTVRQNGIDRRLTDVHGKVIDGILG